MRSARLIVFLLILAFVEGQAPAADRIFWIRDINAGIAAARKESKPLMIDFMADWCEPCRQMEKSTFSNPDIILKAKKFIPVRIDIEKQRPVAKKYGALARAYGGIGIPNILFLSPGGTKLRHIVGYQNPEQLLAVMDSVLKSSKH